MAASAKKLPSGSWRVQAYDYTDSEGKIHRKSFYSTDPSPAGKRDVEAEASAWARNKKTRLEIVEKSYTLEECFERYISNRSSVLSPSTIREYKKIQNRHLKDIMDIPVLEITQALIQREINMISEKRKPKTVRNIHGLLSSVLKDSRPGFALTTRLPQKIKPCLYVPTDAEVAKLFDVIDDKDMIIAVMLAAYGPLRRSEICGLKSEDIKGNTIHVQRAIVMDSNHTWKTKTTKTSSGDRFIELPKFVIDQIKNRSGDIVSLHPNNITDRFEVILKKAGLPHFRFHDLRHYCASSLHAAGVPDAYIMQRGGWGSDAVLKNIYRHTLADKVKSETDKANEHFSNMYCTRNCTRQ